MAKFIKACECPNCGNLCKEDGITIDFTTDEMVVSLNSFSCCEWHCEKCGTDFGTCEAENIVEEFWKARAKTMNKCYFTGRTTKDIEIRYMQGEKQTVVGRFSLAVETGYKDKKRTDFFNMTAWGKTAETMEKYVLKGTKIIAECEARQNNYTDRNGNNVNTVDFTVLNFEFAESKNANQSEKPQPIPQTDSDGFMSIPNGIEEGLPFN